MIQIDDTIVLDSNRMPKHIAIIMDGNGRWAIEKGESRLYGHYQGVQSVRQMVEVAVELNISYLTLYAFSMENWNRPKEEVEGLMELLVHTLKKEVDDLHKNGVRLLVIGDMELLSQHIQAELLHAMYVTKDNKGLSLIMALSYSGRWEIVSAIKKIIKKIQQEDYKIDSINEHDFAQFLYTQYIPDPELLIRTGGEHRISNFLLYQLAYTEFHFTDIKWPDFNKTAFKKAIYDFQQRERRFGKTSQQIQNSKK